jgi:hypothetical protein
VGKGAQKTTPEETVFKEGKASGNAAYSLLIEHLLEDHLFHASSRLR